MGLCDARELLGRFCLALPGMGADDNFGLKSGLFFRILLLDECIGPP
jgi:hypothetical protein